MNCENCKQYDCPNPVSVAGFEPCGNGYRVTTTAPPIDWQTRAEEAERLVAELKSGLAHAQGDLFAAQLRVAAMETEADKSTAELQWLRGVVETHEATLARVREVAEQQAVLDVSNGSWKAAARDVAGKILRALEGGK